MWLPRGMERTLVQPCEWLGSRLLPTDWASSGLSLLMSKGEIWAFYHVVCMRDRSGKGKWQLLSFQKSNMRKGSHPVRLHSRRGPRQSELTSLTSSAHMLCGLALRPLGCHAVWQQISDLLVSVSELPSVPCGGQGLCSEGEPTYPSNLIEDASHASSEACRLERKLLSSGTSLLIFKIVKEWEAGKWCN